MTMNTRTSALYKRTERYNRQDKGRGNMLGAGMAVALAAAPLGLMMWVLPVTGVTFV
jgi:hypothetical protein